MTGEPTEEAMIHLFAALISTGLLIGGIAFIGLTIVRRLDAIVAALDPAPEMRLPFLPLPERVRTHAPRRVMPAGGARSRQVSTPQRAAA